VTTLYLHAGREGPAWQALFARAAPEWQVHAWPAEVDRAQVDFIACWRPPTDFFLGFDALRAVFAFGAGINHLLARPDLPPAVPLVRLTDAGMAAQLAEYALYGVLHWQRDMGVYAAQQVRAEWRPRPPRLRAAVRVGVLGLGAIGAVVASTLASLGYATSGWSRSPRALPGVRCVHGAAALEPLLAQTDVLVNLLPSTAETRLLLDLARLSRLPAGAFVVSAARGDQLDAGALLQLLDRGHLAGALLDVFETEPLPGDSPLWLHPAVRITPHVAAITLPEVSVAQIVAKARALLAGQTVEGVVDRARAY
jgi:glyoxylate/hydroxypyruvate reductase A